MTTQYGFFIDSSRCTGCKTCELACKDYKDLTPDVSFRRIYEYAGGDWQEDNGVWHQNVFAYYLSISCNHCEDPACTKVCPSGRCTSAKTALWWWMRMSASAAATATWPARTVRRSTTPPKAI
ncbi:DMSO reductase iron-sulfur subunit [Leclercia adecarboxylata]|uniref:DMSO reductase iron-sulfur subunit n=1 Tax=Leclercia adecarboxylata TaxID=83655 RepID=A0A4U9HRH7_9ENTR|nr:DMSO reductase iron-sulfur subunit [Leclercia adecarboxylata]